MTRIFSLFSTTLLSFALVGTAAAEPQHGHQGGGPGPGRTMNQAMPRAPFGGAPAHQGAPTAQAMPRPQFDHGRTFPAPAARPQVDSRWFNHTAPQITTPRVVPRGGDFGAYAPRFGATPFHRPYYTFRPRWNVGLGIWAGYPVIYPYYDVGPYGYEYPLEAPGVVTASPEINATGGLSFAIEPDTAEIFVDGQYVGPASNFSATSQPLALVPGRHHIEVRAPGFAAIVFDADVLAGEVIPYQGAMEPLR
jgi:hypothetical protein